MKKTEHTYLETSDDRMIFLLYLFMLMCGFIAGTRLWPVEGIPASELFCEADMIHIFACVAAPAAAVIAVQLLLALFAGGWLLAPIVMYASGVGYGYFACTLFDGTKGGGEMVLCITAAAAYLCCAALTVYMSVSAHRLSRELTCGGKNIIYAYKRCVCSAVVTLAMLAAAAAAFSGVILWNL